MRTELGELLRGTRKSLGLTLSELARRTGYRNLNKGARRLGSLEECGQEAPDLIARVAKELGVDETFAAELWSRDEAFRLAEFEEWLKVPQPMRLLVVPVPGVTCEVPLSGGLAEEQAITIAIEQHRKHRARRTCLIVDRRRSFWIDPDGATYWTPTTRDRPNFPYSRIG